MPGLRVENHLKAQVNGSSLLCSAACFCCHSYISISIGSRQSVEITASNMKRAGTKSNFFQL